MCEVEFYDWKNVPGNWNILQTIIRRACTQADGVSVGEVATLVADRLKAYGVIPLGGPQYGQLFKIIKDVRNEDPDAGFDFDC